MNGRCTRHSNRASRWLIMDSSRCRRDRSSSMVKEWQDLDQGSLEARQARGSFSQVSREDKWCTDGETDVTAVNQFPTHASPLAPSPYPSHTSPFPAQQPTSSGWSPHDRTSQSSPMTPRHTEGRSGRPRLEDWEIVETLGTGTFGRVLLVRQRPSYRQQPYHPIFPHLTHNVDPLSPSVQSTAQADGQLPHFAMKVLRKSEIVRLKQVEHINSERAILERIRRAILDISG